MEKVLKHFHEYGVEKITLKRHESKKTLFHGSSLGNGLNTFQFAIFDDLWNIKLSYLNQLQSIVLIKIHVYSNLHLRHDFSPKKNSHLVNN